jgi:hypothetical protein
MDTIWKRGNKFELATSKLDLFSLCFSLETFRCNRQFNLSSSQPKYLFREISAIQKFEVVWFSSAFASYSRPAFLSFHFMIIFRSVFLAIAQQTSACHANIPLDLHEKSPQTRKNNSEEILITLFSISTPKIIKACPYPTIKTICVF